MTGLIVNGAPYNGQTGNFTQTAGNTAVIVESGSPTATKAAT